ncbi:hypothetical protein AFLA_002685 [Aspergillus flavus NRRL3357]|nr:hypothetical protein AFLA_002685 [Aspergillus flavus NRRL3357]
MDTGFLPDEPRTPYSSGELGIVHPRIQNISSMPFPWVRCNELIEGSYATIGATIRPQTCSGQVQGFGLTVNTPGRILEVKAESHDATDIGLYPEFGGTEPPPGRWTSHDLGHRKRRSDVSFFESVSKVYRSTSLHFLLIYITIPPR